MTPFPYLKQTSQEAGGTPGVNKFQRKLQMNFKEDFFRDTLYLSGKRVVFGPMVVVVDLVGTEGH